MSSHLWLNNTALSDCWDSSKNHPNSNYTQSQQGLCLEIFLQMLFTYKNYLRFCSISVLLHVLSNEGWGRFGSFSLQGFEHNISLFWAIYFLKTRRVSSPTSHSKIYFKLDPNHLKLPISDSYDAKTCIRASSSTQNLAQIESKSLWTSANFISMNLAEFWICNKRQQNQETLHVFESCLK